MLLGIVSVLLNAVFYYVMNLDLYTDRAPMPDGRVREWHRSPVARLNISGNGALFYLYLFFAAVGVIASVLILCGVRGKVIKAVQLACFAVSTAMFILIMILTANTFVNYV